MPHLVCRVSGAADQGLQGQGSKPGPAIFREKETLMATAKKSNRTSQRIAKKQLELRGKLWPKLDQAKLWDRKNTAGFTSIPRAMPLILKVMDELSSSKPLSKTYLDLWCRGFDECFVTITSPAEHAFYAGFSSQRAENTWRDRMRSLVDLGFIETKPGPTGDYHYVLLLNPYLVVKSLFDDGRVSEATYNALCDRMQHIGAKDF